MIEPVAKNPNPARRNKQVHDAILDAAAALLNETEYASVTIDAILIRSKQQEVKPTYFRPCANRYP
jgi:hypothetical protein